MAGSALQGTVFKITPEGKGKVTESLIHEFAAKRMGLIRTPALTPDAAGNLYGVVSNGGGHAFTCTEDSGGGCGLSTS